MQRLATEGDWSSTTCNDAWKRTTSRQQTWSSGIPKTQQKALQPLDAAVSLQMCYTKAGLFSLEDVLLGAANSSCIRVVQQRNRGAAAVMVTAAARWRHVHGGLGRLTAW